ncbi:auxin-induced protein 6B-like [Abrus precatorius]|uniref:Auxin-induced protein 6B-like n=1 Tax=Abrus precatorius TaxID=3816 RepID=A0A8B8M5W3_ABRPR|nr:auxin-induced protein 6B-like [Abrus precatorius]
MLRSFIGKIQKGLSLTRSPVLRHFNEDVLEATSVAPDDVREGYFVVLATKNEETKRFIVELECLTDPAFLKLLEQAREEYGFRQQGALAVPCRPQEFQKILDGRRVHSSVQQRFRKGYRP